MRVAYDRCNAAHFVRLVAQPVTGKDRISAFKFVFSVACEGGPEGLDKAFE